MGEYWPSVFSVQTLLRSIRTANYNTNTLPVRRSRLIKEIYVPDLKVYKHFIYLVHVQSRVVQHLATSKKIQERSAVYHQFYQHTNNIWKENVPNKMV